LSKGWYWVIFRPGKIDGGGRTWAYRSDVSDDWYIGFDNFGDEDIQIIRGPFTEDEIQTAYFGYWV
jgi:hypothetical protein